MRLSGRVSHHFLLALTTFLLGFDCFSSAAIADRPNVIAILADDMGVGDVAAFNGGRNHTLIIDSLAKEGMWFDCPYSASPVCSPARAALLTLLKAVLQHEVDEFLAFKKGGGLFMLPIGNKLEIELATQRLVTFLKECCVFLQRNDIVRVTVDGKHWHLMLGETS